MELMSKSFKGIGMSQAFSSFLRDLEKTAGATTIFAPKPKEVPV